MEHNVSRKAPHKAASRAARRHAVTTLALRDCLRGVGPTPLSRPLSQGVAAITLVLLLKAAPAQR